MLQLLARSTGCKCERARKNGTLWMDDESMSWVARKGFSTLLRIGYADIK